MAGYGGLGGLGGFAFPTRRAMGATPNSAPVQSDQEFNMDWTAKLDATPKTITSYQDIIGTSNGVTSPYRQEANSYTAQNWLGDAGGAELAGRRAAMATADQFGLALQRTNPNEGGPAGSSFGIGANMYTDAGNAVASSMDMGSPSQYVPITYDNPEYLKLSQDYQRAGQQRGENQIRQQQAYDGPFMGNGAIGGVMPSNYGNANFGQITGQKQGGLGGLGGADLTAIDQTQQTGAYMGGSGSYNPNPFSAGSFKSQNPWGGF